MHPAENKNINNSVVNYTKLARLLPSFEQTIDVCLRQIDQFTQHLILRKQKVVKLDLSAVYFLQEKIEQLQSYATQSQLNELQIYYKALAQFFGVIRQQIYSAHLIEALNYLYDILQASFEYVQETQFIEVQKPWRLAFFYHKIKGGCKLLADESFKNISEHPLQDWQKAFENYRLEQISTLQQNPAHITTPLEKLKYFNQSPQILNAQQTRYYVFLRKKQSLELKLAFQEFKAIISQQINISRAYQRLPNGMPSAYHESSHKLDNFYQLLSQLNLPIFATLCQLCQTLQTPKKISLEKAQENLLSIDTARILLLLDYMLPHIWRLHAIEMNDLDAFAYLLYDFLLKKYQLTHLNVYLTKNKTDEEGYLSHQKIDAYLNQSLKNHEIIHIQTQNIELNDQELQRLYEYVYQQNLTQQLRLVLLNQLKKIESFHKEATKAQQKQNELQLFNQTSQQHQAIQEWNMIAKGHFQILKNVLHFLAFENLPQHINIIDLLLLQPHNTQSAYGYQTFKQYLEAARYSRYTQRYTQNNINNQYEQQPKATKQASKTFQPLQNTDSPELDAAQHANLVANLQLFFMEAEDAQRVIEPLATTPDLAIVVFKDLKIIAALQNLRRTAKAFALNAWHDYVAELLVKIKRSNENQKDDQQNIQLALNELVQALKNKTSAPKIREVSAEVNQSTHSISQKKQELTGVFLQEARQLLKNIEILIEQHFAEPLNAVENNSNRAHKLGEKLYPPMHTLVGASRTANCSDLHELFVDFDDYLKNERYKNQGQAQSFQTILMMFPQMHELAQNLLNAWLAGNISPELQAERDLLKKALSFLWAKPDVTNSDDLKNKNDVDVLTDLDNQKAANTNTNTNINTNVNTNYNDANHLNNFNDLNATPKPSQITEDDIFNLPTFTNLDEELAEAFIDEAFELQERIKDDLAKINELQNTLQNNPQNNIQSNIRNLQNNEYVLNIQRYLHTLKGGARTIGFSALGEIYHRLEDELLLQLNSYHSLQQYLPALFNVLQTITQWLQQTPQAASAQGVLNQTKQPHIQHNTQHNTQHHTQSAPPLQPNAAPTNIKTKRSALKPLSFALQPLAAFEETYILKNGSSHRHSHSHSDSPRFSLNKAPISEPPKLEFSSDANLQKPLDQQSSSNPEIEIAISAELESINPDLKISILDDVLIKNLDEKFGGDFGVGDDLDLDLDLDLNLGAKSLKESHCVDDSLKIKSTATTAAILNSSTLKIQDSASQLNHSLVKQLQKSADLHLFFDSTPDKNYSLQQFEMFLFEEDDITDAESNLYELFGRNHPRPILNDGQEHLQTNQTDQTDQTNQIDIENLKRSENTNHKGTLEKAERKPEDGQDISIKISIQKVEQMISEVAELQYQFQEFSYEIKRICTHFSEVPRMHTQFNQLLKNLEQKIQRQAPEKYFDTKDLFNQINEFSKFNDIDNRVIHLKKRMELMTGSSSGAGSGLGFDVKSNDQPTSTQIRTENFGKEKYTDDRRYNLDALEFDDYYEHQHDLNQLNNLINASKEQIKKHQQALESISTQTQDLHDCFIKIQEQLHDLSLLDLTIIETRLQAIAQVCAREQKKEMRLLLKIQAIKVPKTILDQINFMCEHLIRNAIIHGIEDAQNRLHKPKIGLIIIEIRQKGDQLYFKIMDDGGGIHVEKIQQKAVQNGRLKAGGTASREQLIEWMLEPGFSTADLTLSAGRGIGLDTVLANIKQNGGEFLINSPINSGLIVEAYLPLLSFMSDILIAQAGDYIFGIPTSYIEEVLLFDGTQKYTAMSDIMQSHNHHCQHFIGIKTHNGLEYIALNIVEYCKMFIRNTPLIFHPKGLIGMSISKQSKLLAIYNPIMLVQYHQKQHMQLFANHGAGTKGDDFKNIRANYLNQQVMQYQHSTHQQNYQLSQSWRTRAAQNEQPHLNPFNITEKLSSEMIEANISNAPTRPILKKQPHIMAVDDSATIRLNIQKHLNKNYQIHLAMDGIDALEQLEKLKQKNILMDLFLLDIEMPRMDGFELLQAIRQNADYQEIPVIMLSSRQGEKYQTRAYEWGANDYLTKPYQAQELSIRIIREITKSQKLKKHRGSL